MIVELILNSHVKTEPKKAKNCLRYRETRKIDFICCCFFFFYTLVDTLLHFGDFCCWILLEGFILNSLVKTEPNSSKKPSRYGGKTHWPKWHTCGQTNDRSTKLHIQYILFNYSILSWKFQKNPSINNRVIELKHTDKKNPKNRHTGGQTHHSSTKVHTT